MTTRSSCLLDCLRSGAGNAQGEEVNSVRASSAPRCLFNLAEMLLGGIRLHMIWRQTNIQELHGVGLRIFDSCTAIQDAGRF